MSSYNKNSRYTIIITYIPTPINKTLHATRNIFSIIKKTFILNRNIDFIFAFLKCSYFYYRLCMLYRAFNGEPLASGVVERREDYVGDGPEYRKGEGPSVGSPPSGHHDPSLPPTPCPAKVDYATPVFAKNYQGVWRYVVQIPYEGYFTQTIEVTRCL